MKLIMAAQTYRTNEQMMQAMKGATVALGSMNKSMNLPQLQRIAMEFERENDIMDQRQEMMDDAIDDAMDTGVEEEGDEVVEQVLEEIGVDLSQSVSHPFAPNQRPFLAVYTDHNDHSSERHLLGYQPMPSPKDGWLKQSEVVGVIPATMIFRLVWIVSGDNLPIQEAVFRTTHNGYHVLQVRFLAVCFQFTELWTSGRLWGGGGEPVYSVALENSDVAWKAMTRPFEISAPGSVLCS